MRGQDRMVMPMGQAVPGAAGIGALLIAAVLVALPLAAHAAGPAEASGPAARCARMGDDDTVQGYDPTLRDGFLRAWRKSFPGGTTKPDEALLRAQSHYRCMDGHLYACFTGANLPCDKLDQRRENAGAEAFCRANPASDSIPMAATGHDTPYEWRCRNGRAEVVGTVQELDARGFGKALWTRMN
ncbi:hypothetical protein [Roseomonas gilardii]|uniref:hypothetical protein n=2 Tax=Roseomonas gilardii TaxID=257708 RepID=UPI0004AF2CE0|nr:hypothetical protein [Roseomonas gilardii]SUE43377.1 Uncharacterised protein [Roseomonas gilardii subsp. rosea]